MPGQGPEVKTISAEVPSFAPERIDLVADVLLKNIDEIAGRMAPLPLEIAKGIVDGEAKRIRGIGSQSWPFFYQQPLEALQRADLIPQRHSEVEIGSSLVAQIAARQPSLQPREYRGRDLPEIVPAAQAALAIYQQAGLLPKEGYSVTVKREDGAKADVILQILLTQYKGAIETIYEGEQEADILITGDIAHGPDELPASIARVEPGVIVPIMAHGEKTGFVWCIGNDLGDTGMGEAYEAMLDFDPDRQYDKEKVHHLQRVGDTKETTVLVYEENGRRLIDGWGYVPGKNATQEDMQLARDINQTIHDLWKYCDWEGKAILAIPSVAAQHSSDLWSAVTYKKLSLNGRAVPNMILRNRKDMVCAYEAGQLTQVGVGKAYEFNDFMTAIQQAFMNGMFDRIELLQPFDVSVTTVRSNSDLKRFMQAAG